jgi:hypothetical protein
MSVTKKEKKKKSILEPREAKVNGLDHWVARFLTPSLVRNKRHDLTEFRIFLCPTSWSYLNWPINICTSDDIQGCSSGAVITASLTANCL